MVGAALKMGWMEKIGSQFGALLPIGGVSSVGLSIGTSSIKLVEIKKTGKTWKLLNAAIASLAEDAIVNREILNAVSVSESIREVLSKLKIKNKNVCTSLSGTSVIIKRLSVDVPKKSELEAQVFWEAEQYLPFDPSDVVMDYHVLSRAKDGKTDVMLVAAKRSILDAYMHSVEDAGLKAKIVDTDYFALETVFEANYPTQPQEAVALVDIGSSSIKMVVVHDGVPIYTKDSSIGGNNLTTEIQKHLGVTYRDAEALKTGNSSKGLPQEVVDLMNIMAENFATEIKRANDFYSAQGSGAPLTQILVTGGSSKIPGLTKSIEDICRLPCQLLNPFHSITYDPSRFTPESIAVLAPHLAIPIGLAIRGASK